ncbi:hypothetical protein GCM10009655_16190 [Rhodoglobus aureus]|uniref:Uncharacterized protein n=1 Tax=Rhodoglobus aureus TaxID=191497 RepID=A0ABN1VQ98_9MICO
MQLIARACRLAKSQGHRESECAQQEVAKNDALGDGGYDHGRALLWLTVCSKEPRFTFGPLEDHFGVARLLGGDVGEQLTCGFRISALCLNSGVKCYCGAEQTGEISPPQLLNSERRQVACFVQFALMQAHNCERVRPHPGGVGEAVESALGCKLAGPCNVRRGDENKKF